MSEDNNETVAQAQRLNAHKARAVREAMIEIVGEQRAEILRRARAKLIAAGVSVEDADVEPQVP